MHLAPASSSAPRQRIVTIILTMFGLLIVAIVANMSFFSYRLNSGDVPISLTQCRVGQQL